MVGVDNLWHLKTFEAVLTNLQRRWDEVIHEQNDVSTHCTEICKLNDEMDGKEVVDLSSENQTTISELHDREETTKQEKWNKMKKKPITRVESKSRPKKTS